MTDLDKANKNLQGLDTAKNDFLKMISHEIRTPLNGIVGAAYLLNDVMGDDNEFGEFVDILKVSVDRLENFSTTALVITQLQADNYLISKELNKAENVVDSCIDSLEEYSKEQNLDIRKGIVDSSIEINIDEKLFKRALKSVIHNAIKYSPEKDKVTVNTLTDEKTTIIEVVDRGKGFNEEALDKLFQPFGMGEKHYDQNVGLSLRAAKMIMKAHNGDIIIENQSGKGAKVSLVINN
jgi:signal transduction histidine kinase